MSYQFGYLDYATRAATVGTFTGRCPMTGRFVSGQEFGDDEPVEHLFGVVYDPTNDIIAYLDGDVEVVDVSDDDYGFAEYIPEEWYSHESAADWAEQSFRTRFPHLWEEEHEDDVPEKTLERFDYHGEGESRWFEMNHDFDDETITVRVKRRVSGKSFVTNVAIGDNEAMPMQSHEQRDDYIRELGYSADKCEKGWQEAHGKRGRQKRTARMHCDSRAIARDKRTIWDEFREYSYYYASKWLDEMAEFAGNLEFPATINGDIGRYYQRLLANNVTREGLAMWAEDYGDMETDAQRMRREAEEDAEYYWSIGYDPEASRWEALEEACYNEEFLRKPLYVTGDDFGMFTHRHAGNYSTHGWGNTAPEVSYVDRGWEFLMDPFLRRILRICPSSLLHNLEELYEAAYWENGMPTEEEMRVMEEAREAEVQRKDDIVESRTFAQTGGLRGIKAAIAAKTERLRVHDFANVA
jgi:hypothetical protein